MEAGQYLKMNLKLLHYNWIKNNLTFVYILYLPIIKMQWLASLLYSAATLYFFWSSGVLAMGSATVTKISWTLSKPPAALFRWETSHSDPKYTLASLSEGPYVLQAIATDAAGTSTHSGVIQGNISDTAQTIQVILNPLIQADATMFQQPSYIKWVKTNSTTVYPDDVIELTMKGASNPANSDMQFTINSQVVCTSKDECVVNHTIPSTATDPYTIQLAVVGMGYSIPMEFMVKDYVPVEFRAVFNVPPVIDQLESAISMLHQIGTSTTVTAKFTDPEASNVKYTWTTEAIQGTCPITELSGTLTDTVASGSTVSVVFTPTTLGNKCIVKIRCEDSQGAVSLGEVYIYVDNVPIYFPPYVVSKLQSSQTASIGDKIDFSLEMCEPQEQMVTVSWSSECGTLDHAADTITNSEDCHWIYNHVTLASVPCNVIWTATDSDASVSTGKFRILSSSRRLENAKVPRVYVTTTKTKLTTVMDWSLPKESSTSSTMEKEIKRGLSGEGIGLIVVCSVLFLVLIIFGVLYKTRKVECIVPEKKPDVGKKVETDIEMPNVNKLKTMTRIQALRGGRGKPGMRARSPRNIDKPMVQKEEDGDVITPQMIARGSRRQMRMKRKEKLKKERLEKTKNKLLPMRIKEIPMEHPDHSKVQDSQWEENIKAHRSINRHPNAGTRRNFNATSAFKEKT